MLRRGRRRGVEGRQRLCWPDIIAHTSLSRLTLEPCCHVDVVVLVRYRCQRRRLDTMEHPPPPEAAWAGLELSGEAGLAAATRRPLRRRCVCSPSPLLSSLPSLSSHPLCSSVTEAHPALQPSVTSSKLIFHAFIIAHHGRGSGRLPCAPIPRRRGRRRRSRGS